MPIINKANGLVAEFAIFPAEPHSQESLIKHAIQNIESTLKHKVGFSSGSVLRSRDGLRVTSYVQWTDSPFAQHSAGMERLRQRESYLANQSFKDFTAPDVHLFEIFAAEPEGTELSLSLNMNGLINFGIFKMKQPENQPRFVELFTQALGMVSGQTGLISTHAHRSFDGWRCINFGHWQSLEAFTEMDSNRPFSPIFGEMLDLADNEYQKTLHEVVFTT
jgi:heme-degrading monooxygenase HmoA